MSTVTRCGAASVPVVHPETGCRAQVRGQLADPVPYRPGGLGGAVRASGARDVERGARGLHRREVPRVEVAYLVRRVERHRAQQRRVARREHLREPAPVRVAVQVDASHAEAPDHARQVARDVRGTEQVRRVHPGPVGMPPGVVQLVGASAHQGAEVVGRGAPGVRLERRAVEQRRPSGPARVDHEQVVVGVQRPEHREEVRRWCRWTGSRARPPWRRRSRPSRPAAGTQPNPTVMVPAVASA